MFSRKTLRAGSCVWQLVECRLAEADCKRFDRAVGMPDHVRDDGAGVNSAAQERADRHVADHVYADRLLELFAQLFDQVLLGRAAIRLE